VSSALKCTKNNLPQKGCEPLLYNIVPIFFAAWRRT